MRDAASNTHQQPPPRGRVLKFLGRHSAYGPWGLLVASLGCVAFCFAAFGLCIVGAQLFMINVLPHPADPSFTEFRDFISIIHRLWLLYMPLMALGGVLGIAGGLLLHCDRELGRRLSQVAALYALVWGTAYSIDSMTAVPLMARSMAATTRGSGPAAMAELQKAIAVPSAVIFFVVFIALPALLVLWHTRRRRRSDGNL